MAKLKDFIVKARLGNTDKKQKMGNPDFDTQDYVFLESVDDVKNMSDEDRYVYASDYTVMNGACLGFEKKGFQNRRAISYKLRSCELVGTEYGIVEVKPDGYIARSPLALKSDGLCPALHLNLLAVISARKKLSAFKIEAVKDRDDKVLYHTIEFGFYPQDKAENGDELERLFQKCDLTKTGKEYVGYLYEDGTYSPKQEFEYKGKKYVRVVSQKYDTDSEFKDGTEAPRSETPVWAEVQPIKWKIKNWDDLPKVLNPNGNGSAVDIYVRTEDAILTALPFFLKNNTMVGAMWQNSLIRAYLNGYDLHEEIDKGNGNSEYKAETGYDLKGRGFIEEALDMELNTEIETNNETYQNETEYTEPQGRRSRLEKLNPDTTPATERRRMTDTEMIKSWIDAGQSVLLRGPSGIGKTERIKKLYPDLIYIKLTNNMFPEKVVGSMNLQTGQSIPPDFAKQALLACATDEERKLIQENVQNLYELADTIYERSKTAEGKVVILLDELLNVKPAVQSLVYTLVLNKLVETGKGLKLPANTVVVATGNQKKYSSVAEDLAEPLEKRFDHILDMEPKVGEWIYEYAIPEKIHPSVIGYIFSKYQQQRRSEKIDKIGYFYEEPEVGETHLDKNGCRGRTNDPRGWVSISSTLYAFEEDLKNGKFAGKDVEALLKSSLASKLREEWAEEFFDFYNHPTLSVEDIVAKRYTQADLPRDINEKFATMAGLLNAELDEVAECRDFIRKYCDPEYLSVYDIYWAGNDEKRMEKLAELWELDKVSQNDEEISKATPNPSKKYKITIDEFFASEEKLAIATPTEEQAKILCKVFDKMGKKWSSGDSYLSKNCWNDERENTAYTNKGAYDSRRYYEREDTPIYDFEDVDMEKYLDEPTKDEKYKITIDEFFASDKKLAIATPTKEQAEILCKVFDKMGKTWTGGRSFLASTNWDDERENTAYSNRCTYHTSSFFLEEGTPIYNFDEVDMEKYLDEEDREKLASLYDKEVGE